MVYRDNCLNILEQNVEFFEYKYSRIKAIDQPASSHTNIHALTPTQTDL